LGTGTCWWRGYKECVHLPFAGITLFRFYGFVLSLYETKHPEEIFITKVKKNFILPNVTLITNFRFAEKRGL
jgi:hypothetical protein